jgi:tRNA(Ile)-lysidine synthase
MAAAGGLTPTPFPEAPAGREGDWRRILDRADSGREPERGEQEALNAWGRVSVLPRGPVLVALGGGADSALLAWAVRQNRRRVRAATVDHGLPESPALIAAAQALAADLGIGHRVLPCAPAGTSEAALRVARYAALEAEAGPDEIIATGHTADDQAETVLGNLLRGAGSGGLSGIPARRGRWFRPLLRLTREEVRAAADVLHLPYADDPGNADLSHRRNVLRHEAIPLLEERFGPGVRPALRRAAGLLAADDAELERRAAAVQVRLTPDGVFLPAAVLATLPWPVAARVVRRALRLVLTPYPGHQRDVEAVRAVVTCRSGTSLPVQGGHLAVREGAWVVVRPAADPVPPAPAALPVPGAVRFGGWAVGAEGPMAAGGPAPVGRRAVLIDAAAAVGGLTVRAAVPGDRVDIGAGHKPVAEALREAGVPAARRGGWPVVVSGGTIAWVPGVRLAAWAAPRGSMVVRLSLREAE